MAAHRKESIKELRRKIGVGQGALILRAENDDIYPKPPKATPKLSQNRFPKLSHDRFDDEAY